MKYTIEIKVINEITGEPISVSSTGSFTSAEHALADARMRVERYEAGVED